MIEKFLKILENKNVNYTKEGDNLTVGGYLNLRGTNITSLPDNLTVGGYLNLEGTNITSLPDNLTVGGDLYLRGTNITSLPDNLTVGGDLYLEGTNITSLPDNLTVGGDLDLRGTNIKKKKVKKPKENFWQNLKLDIKLKLGLDIKLSWKNGKYRKIDGLFCEVLEQKRNIIKVKIRNKQAFIFQKNGIYAHGNTVKQAYFDWLFKTSDRDVEKYKNIKSDEVHPLDWWVVAYRIITGACSFGTNNYLETNKDKYKDKMTLLEVIEATKGQYGSDTFREFFKG
jgi:small nuclear ribonucleoprotein (snRNP)-like protein